jgi:hypothetical protein
MSDVEQMIARIKWEYLRVGFYSDITELNHYGEEGWKVISILPSYQTGEGKFYPFWALLERDK